MIEAVLASMNDTFDGIFPVVYWILLAVFFIGVVLCYIFWCAEDSPFSRGVIPWAFLIAVIVNGLIAIWIIVYISAIYPRDKVYTPK